MDCTYNTCSKLYEGIETLTKTYNPSTQSSILQQLGKDILKNNEPLINKTKKQIYLPEEKLSKDALRLVNAINQACTPDIFCIS